MRVTLDANRTRELSLYLMSAAMELAINRPNKNLIIEVEEGRPVHIAIKDGDILSKERWF